MQLFRLSREDIELAKAEVAALCPGKHSLYGNLLIAKGAGLAKRLAYTHTVYEFLFRTEDLAESLRAFGWQEHYYGSFCVRLHGFENEDAAKVIWSRLAAPRVDLENPGSRFDFFKVGRVYVCGRFIADTDKSYMKRKAHLRPRLHPTSMHPRLARACINLSGVKKGRLLDPFCGSGGILIEAGLMGYDLTGYDLEPEMLDRCRANLEHYGLKSKLTIRDSTTLREPFDLIVTDLPYGRNSKKSESLDSLYMKFLTSARKTVPAAVVVFPDFADLRKAVKGTGWRILSEFTHYVHRSLSRKIVVLG